MQVGRRLGLVMTMALGLCGCRAAGTGSLWPRPQPALAQTSLDVEAFVAEHNRNSERIQSLEARQPSITVTVPRRPPLHMEGKIALERPQNFKLELSAAFGSKKVADIGSNEQEFWFWVQSDEDKSVYWCNYADLGSSPVPAAYQPDWIIEALGLNPITPDEAAQIRQRKGPYPGTTALVFPTSGKTRGGQARVMIVSDRERRIKEYRLCTADLTTVIAQATPSRYKEFPAGSASVETCYLPERIKLEWKRDQLGMDVALGSEVELNQFEASRRTALFIEPEIPGYTRRNLAELSGSRSRQEPRTMTRQTMPPPERHNGVELGRPAPLPDDGDGTGTIVPRLGQSPATPRSQGSPRIPPPLEDLVGAPRPSPPVSQSVQAAYAGLNRDESFWVER